MVRTSQKDVLVVGAGPSGLMAAQALARLGISVQIIDRRAPGALYGNADGLQPRTLEIWQSYGLLEKFAPNATAMHAIIAYEQGEDGKGLKRSTPSRNVVAGTRYPYELTASIETIEETLRNSMEAADAHVMQPVVPLSIEIDSAEKSTYPVKVVLQHLPSDQFPPPQGLNHNAASLNGNGSMKVMAPETEVVLAKYVIGADGAHSWVRRHLGIPMKGDRTEYVWGVVDVTVETDFPDCRFKCVIQASQGALIIIPREDEKIRIYVQLSPQDSIKTPDGRIDKSASPEMVRAKVLEHARERFQPYKVNFKHVFWCTIFSVPQAVATRYSFLDRVFIVGDACHTHSPKAGQGANASMGDSHNLAWKIAHVLRGWATESLLDTYEVERRTYAHDLIAFDKRIAQCLDGGTGADYQGMLHEQNMFTSGIGIMYQSRLTDSRGDHLALHLKAGERLPPSRLVRLGDWEPTELQDLVPSDGLFKVLIFPRDIVLPNQRARLITFSETLGRSMLPEMTKRTVYTILSSLKENVHWSDVPEPLQCWKRVFVSEDDGEGAYIRFGIAYEGAAILVRPDGYISLLTELSGVGAQQISTFLCGL